MKKGLDLMIAVGKPKIGAPPRPKAMGMPEEEEGMTPEEAQADEGIDQKTYDCVKRLEGMIEKIADALGIDVESGEEGQSKYEEEEER